MGGQQAASVLLQVRLDNLRARGEDMTPAEQEDFMRPTLEKYEVEGSAYYSTARLWDDGILDPADTRATLGLAISASLNAPIGDALRRVQDVRGTWLSVSACRHHTPSRPAAPPARLDDADLRQPRTLVPPSQLLVGQKVSDGHSDAIVHLHEVHRERQRGQLAQLRVDAGTRRGMVQHTHQLEDQEVKREGQRHAHQVRRA